ncbi:acetyl-coenzyme A synthetase [Aeropyrum pernix K1]|uniref:acetate--CoA ligase n=1 Tax=Aeropyrum pernix (strain ATCC 700893 / DSM 11879 / JCM 9820 / NBRC 100138 / K1) TaxID=272557 RepID=Q9YCA8_AERPE|nr:AMP-binding protein [Aeropyrum pernix]BAA80340.2 acetyl-coenzyme A synthetase [Aeropyrum pernix K1]
MEKKIWYPPRDIVDQSNVKLFMDKHGFKSYEELVRRSSEDLKWFWGNLPEWLGVEWFREPKAVVDLSRGVEWAQWYRGGLLNAAYNVVDRIVKMGYGHREAFTWVGEDGEVRRYTYLQLKDEVDRMAKLLSQDYGLGVGDVVAIYAPMMPESIAAMLAAMKVGAVASPIFSGFAPPAVAERLKLGEARVLVTVDGYLRRGRRIALKEQADQAVKLAGGAVEHVIVVRRLGIDVPWVEGRDEWYDRAIAGKAGSAEPEELDPEHPALLLFTSGTTGRPKGAVISHAGAILQPGKEHYFNLDIHPAWRGGEDRLWWITDIGWMMGPWQVLGSQLLGASHLMAEGAIDYPYKSRVWRLIQEHRVTHFGFAATVARMLRAVASDTVEDYDLSSIRAFGNTGEPIDHATWMWVMEKLGGWRRPLINLSGGTEVFGCILLPSPVVPLKPTTLWGPALGVDADVFDDEGRPVRGEPGYLVVKKPFPSMTRGLWKDPERYIKTYWSRFPGVWYHGDYALVDEDGFWYILGRADDVIKVAGKRIGSAELESVLTQLPEVAEAACIGVPHPIKGEVIACFLVPKGGYDAEELASKARKAVVDRFGKPFAPEHVVIVSELPKTRSGKITRRVLRDLARGVEPKELSVLENPEAVEKLRDIIKRIGGG